jgi:propionyl-CoA carboxylase alpha chain/3-methylcrotonyl-CoA carboxylase alpha subunit/acetyl-CoA/propionyl-CoA carboxylase biotin carboxyl carrier protein
MNYRGAGTFEFLFEDNEFYFIEMNTRVQVEHPVTEMITGMDLVRTQIEIAGGLGLPCTQAEVAARGHAIECRICAEDPGNDFLPETGEIAVLEVPHAPWLRFESALSKGQKVTADFDPMLAKLVVHGATRDAATDRAIDALEHLDLMGVQTNIDYLARALGHHAFRAGDLHTGFIAEHADALTAVPLDAAQRAIVLAAAALGLRDVHDAATGTPQPFAAMGNWRN